MTNRCAIGEGALAAAVGPAAFSSAESSVATSAGITASPAFSMENLEITCGLPLSKSRKSSFWSVPMAFPLASRTTTGTSTRFTFVLNVAGASREVISGVFCPGVFAGAWPRDSSPEIPPNSNRAAVAAPLTCTCLLTLLHFTGRSLKYLPLIEARQQLQIFFRHRFQWIPGPAPGPETTGDYVRIESLFAQDVRHTGAGGFAQSSAVEIDGRVLGQRLDESVQIVRFDADRTQH